MWAMGVMIEMEIAGRIAHGAIGQVRVIMVVAVDGMGVRRARAKKRCVF